MSFPVFHVGDQAFRLAQFFADQLHDVDVAHLIMSADVIDFSDASVMDHQINRFAVVFHIQPVTDVQTFSIDRKRFVVQTVCDHQRDQFFREMIWPVIVGTTADRHRKPIGSVVSHHKQIRSRLGGTVRTAGVDRCFLRKEQVRTIQGQISVNLVRGYLMVSLDPVFPAGVHQDGRPHDIRLQKDARILD